MQLDETEAQIADMFAFEMNPPHRHFGHHFEIVASIADQLDLDVDYVRQVVNKVTGREPTVEG